MNKRTFIIFFSWPMFLVAVPVYADDEHSHIHSEKHSEAPGNKGPDLIVSLVAETNEEVDHGPAADRGPGIYPELLVEAGYSLSSTLKIASVFGYKAEVGATDPELQLGYVPSLSDNIETEFRVFATAPASEESRGTDRMSTVGVEVEPSIGMGKLTFALHNKLEYNFYKKEGHGSKDRESETTLAQDEDSQSAEEHHEHEREKTCLGTELEMAYEINDKFEAGIGAGVSRATHMESPSNWETEAKILEIGYTLKNFSSNLAYGYRSESEKLLLPNQSVVAFGISYSR